MPGNRLITDDTVLPVPTHPAPDNKGHPLNFLRLFSSPATYSPYSWGRYPEFFVSATDTYGYPAVSMKKERNSQKIRHACQNIV